MKFLRITGMVLLQNPLAFKCVRRRKCEQSTDTNCWVTGQHTLLAVIQSGWFLFLLLICVYSTDSIIKVKENIFKKKRKIKSLRTQYTYNDLFFFFFSLHSYVHIFLYVALIQMLSPAFFFLTSHDSLCYCSQFDTVAILSFLIESLGPS